MSALDELLKDIPQDYDFDAVEVANNLIRLYKPAVADLTALREQVEKMAVILQWIYDDGEGGTYRPDIQAVLVAHNQSQ